MWRTIGEMLNRTSPAVRWAIMARMADLFVTRARELPFEDAPETPVDTEALKA